MCISSSTPCGFMKLSLIHILKAIKQLYDSSAAFQSLKPVYDGLQKLKFEKPRAKYKACLLYTSRCV